VHHKLAIGVVAMIALAAGVMALAPASRQAAAAGVDGADILVDPSRRHQTLSGWEVPIRGWEQDKVNDRYDDSWREARDEVARALVDDVGVNRLRLEVRSNAENRTDYWTRFVNGEETLLFLAQPQL